MKAPPFLPRGHSAPEKDAPPRPREVADGVCRRFGIATPARISNDRDLVDAAEKFGIPAIAGLATLFAYQTIRFVRANPELLGNAVEHGVRTTSSVFEHWDEIALAGKLVDFLGTERTLSLLKAGGEFAVNHAEWVSRFLDGGEILSDIIDGLTSLGLGLAAGYAVKKGFEQLNDAKEKRLADLMQQRACVENLRALLRAKAPPVQVAQMLHQIDRRHWRA